MKHHRKAHSIAICAAGLFAAATASVAQAFDVQAGDWKLTVSGNVNAHYIYSSCESTPSVIITVGGACTADANGDGNSSVSNGLLPAALSVSGATTQGGYDIGVTFGLYPGISTNDGGSPNLQATPGPTNTALGTAGLDVRQVFLTFGNKGMGTVLAGRNIGLFGADAILNDMTLVGVGVGGAASTGAPANTSLGSIGFGYIYTDWLAQIDYTTPDFSGFKFTLGIFDPIESITSSTATTKKEPGFHAKAAWKVNDNLYFSASFLYQKQAETAGSGAVSVVTSSYDGEGFDIGGKWDIGGFELLGWYYTASGLGTTGLFVLSSAANGNKRDSDGFLAQATYKISNTKLGVNYGESKLKLASGEVNPFLLDKNDKVTVGIYQSMTPNLTLLAEFSGVETKAQNGNKNKSENFNIGAFVSF
jgi:predicted porin